MQKIISIIRIIRHVGSATSPMRALIFSVIVFILLAVLLIKAINIFIPFTYLAL